MTKVESLCITLKRCVSSQNSLFSDANLLPAAGSHAHARRARRRRARRSSATSRPAAFGCHSRAAVRVARAWRVSCRSRAPSPPRAGRQGRRERRCRNFLPRARRRPSARHGDDGLLREGAVRYTARSPAGSARGGGRRRRAARLGVAPRDDRLPRPARAGRRSSKPDAPPSGYRGRTRGRRPPSAAELDRARRTVPTTRATYRRPRGVAHGTRLRRRACAPPASRRRPPRRGASIASCAPSRPRRRRRAPPPPRSARAHSPASSRGWRRACRVRARGGIGRERRRRREGVRRQGRRAALAQLARRGAPPAAPAARELHARRLRDARWRRAARREECERDLRSLALAARSSRRRCSAALAAITTAPVRVSELRRRPALRRVAASALACLEVCVGGSELLLRARWRL